MPSSLRVLRVAGGIAGTAVVFVSATAAAALLHLDAPVTRRLVATQVTKVLRDTLAGDVTIEHIAELGLHGIAGARIRVRDPEGVQVLFVDGARARIDALDIARSLLFEKKEIVLEGATLSIDHVEAAVDGDAAGQLRIANAFTPRPPTTPPKPPEPNARGLRVEAHALELKHAWVHGEPPGAPPIDAELKDLEGRLHVDPKSTRADLDHVDLLSRGMPRRVDPRGRITANLVMPSATGQAFGLTATFEGAIAGVPATARVGLDGKKLDAVVDGHDASGQGVRETFSELGMHEELTLHAEAHGELPKLGAKAHVALGRGTVDVDGTFDGTNGADVHATVALRHVDARSISASAPTSDVGLDGRGHVFLAKDGARSGDFTIASHPGTVAGVQLPILNAHGELAKSTVHAKGTIVDPRAKADFDATLDTARGTTADARLAVDAPDLSKLPKLGALAKGRASVTADAHANLEAKTLDAHAHVLGAGVAYGAQSVADLTVVASALGALDHPTIDVGVHAARIASGNAKIDVADVRGRVAPGHVTTIDDAHVDAVRAGHTVSVFAKRVQVGGPRVVVDGAVVEGVGRPIAADFSKDANVLRAKIEAPDVDLGLVSVLAGKPRAALGHVAAVGDVTLRRNGATGKMHVVLTDLDTRQIHGGKGELDASFADRAVGLQAKVELGRAGRFELATRNVVLAGSPVALDSWKRAHGAAKVDAQLDMETVRSMLPEDPIPFSDLRGLLAIAGTLRRDSSDVPPEMSVHAQTRGLVIAGRTPLEAPHDIHHGPRVAGVQPWRSQGVDASVDARVDATSGFGELAFQLVDKKGALFAFDAKADLPYHQLVSDPSKAKTLLRETPVVATLVVPKRALADLPEMAGTRKMPGTIEGSLVASGTMLDPRIDVSAHGRGMRLASLSEQESTDADLHVTYDGTKAELLARAFSQAHEALEAKAVIDITARDFFEPEPGRPLAWDGSASVRLAGFALETIGPIADRRIKGRVSGEATLTDLHRDAKVHARLGLDGLKVGRAKYEKGTITVDTHDGELVGAVRLEQNDGHAEVRATSGLVWGAAVVPSLAKDTPMEAHLDAKAFRAAAILPFVQGALNDLDGRIDADANVKIGPGGNTTMSGKVALREGVLSVASFGDEMKDVRATVTFQEGGVIKVDDIFSRGGSGGEIVADATIKTRGLSLVSAVANAHIPARHALDVGLQGQPIGSMSGDVKLMATTSEDAKAVKMTVDAPSLKVMLPQRLKSGVQELGLPEGIRVGVFRDRNTFVRLPLQRQDLEAPKEAKPVGAILDVDIRLGEITIIQGNQARVVLGGNPHVHVTNQTQVTGQIQVTEGKLDVQGKQFEIEKGTITFQPNDPSNPIVVATAEWTAEDGTKVYADFVGPVKTGKVNLRSDPPRPKNEILAIILFGTADGANATAPPPGQGTDGTTKAATTLGGGFAAQGLTEAMDDLTGLQATARIDTTRSTNPAPEIEVQIARRISIAFAHILGTPPISEPDTNLAIVNWRFTKQWSLEVTFGDRGKVATDAVWTKRY
jgi:translocation and assembly module TamB